MNYFPELWEFYGLTPLTIWDVEAHHFFSMAGAIDGDRTRREKEERESAREAAKNSR